MLNEKTDSSTQTLKEKLKAVDNSTLTDENFIDEWLNQRFKAMHEERQRKKVDKITETNAIYNSFAELTTDHTYENNDDQFIMIPFQKCDGSSICSSSGNNEPYEKIIVDEPETIKSKLNTLKRSKSVENVNNEINNEAYYRKSKISRSRPVSLNLLNKTIMEQKNNGSLNFLKFADTHINLINKFKDSSSSNEFIEKSQLNSKNIDDYEDLELGEFYDEEYDMDSDRLSIETDAQTVIMVDINTGKRAMTTEDTPVKILDPNRTEAIRKLLTESQRNNQSLFQRDVGSYRSYRTEKNKSDDLDYIAERHSNVIFILNFFIF